MALDHDLDSGSAKGGGQMVGVFRKRFCVELDVGCKRKKRVMGDARVSSVNEGRVEKLVTETGKIRTVTGCEE